MALLGLVMLLTPGPGLAVIVAGLAILAIEFAWARRLLANAKARMQAAGQALRRRTGRGGDAEEPGAPAPDDAGQEPAGSVPLAATGEPGAPRTGQR